MTLTNLINLPLQFLNPVIPPEKKAKCGTEKIYGIKETRKNLRSSMKSVSMLRFLFVTASWFRPVLFPLTLGQWFVILHYKIIPHLWNADEGHGAPKAREL